jgi:dTDP-4-amino-4,6-dideoxygalactose transaminase
MIRAWEGEPNIGGWYTRKEEIAALSAIRSCMSPHSKSKGYFREKFEAEFAEFVGVKHSLAVNGAGSGLELVLRALQVTPEDEILSCAINFHGTHVAIIGTGAKLIITDPQAGTLNICVDDAARKIGPRTKAIVVTHMNGLPADLDDLASVIATKCIGQKQKPKIIVDAARACGASYRNERVGKQGWATVFSFHRKKLMTTLGEGGMITTDDAELFERLRCYRSFGDTKSWGSNFQMTDVQAAVGSVQLSRLPIMNRRRRSLAGHRNARLESHVNLQIPLEPYDRTHVYYLYTLCLKKSIDTATAEQIRNTIITRLADQYGIGCVVANRPTYQTNPWIAQHLQGQTSPVADDLGARIFCPSLHPVMTQRENNYISDAISEVCSSSCS